MTIFRYSGKRNYDGLYPYLANYTLNNKKKIKV